MEPYVRRAWESLHMPSVARDIYNSCLSSSLASLAASMAVVALPTVLIFRSPVPRAAALSLVAGMSIGSSYESCNSRMKRIAGSQDEPARNTLQSNASNK